MGNAVREAAKFCSIAPLWARAGWPERIDSTARNRYKGPQSTAVTHCLFDPRAGTSRLGQGQKRTYARTYWRYHALYPVRLGARPVGAFFPAAADPGLPYRRVRHWSIRHGLGQVPGLDQHVISELGLIFMLFMIGLEIDLKKIMRAGKVILFAARRADRSAASCSGVLFFIAIGMSMGGGKFDALYLCVACALSIARSSSSRCSTRSASSTRCPAASRSACWCCRISSRSCSWRCSRASTICRSA